MFRNSALLVVLALIFLVIPLQFTVAKTPIVNVSKRAFSESFPDFRQVNSVGLVAGVQVKQAPYKLNEPVVYVSGIKPSDKFICVSISHVGGTYIANFRVRNPRKGSIVGLKMPSKLFDNAYVTSTQLAVNARVTDKSICSKKDSHYLVSNWRDRFPVEAVDIYIAIDPSSVARFNLKGTSGAVNCNSIEVLNRKKGSSFREFTQYCRMKLPPSCKPSAYFEIIVDPIRGKSRQKNSASGYLRRGC
ncbi:hypothetical protein [Parasphingorhabdus sp.]|jgi:hypothetical protein|uniref:hypothetical protein n=1 Tax=Parasphingorhabdus sp. TaxID=2709688 RepID=UPI003D266DA6